MNVEANTLAVMTTITSDAQWEHDGTRGKTEHFRAIELNDVERFIGATSGGIGRFWGVGIIALRTYALRQLPGHTFRLSQNFSPREGKR